MFIVAAMLFVTFTVVAISCVDLWRLVRVERARAARIRLTATARGMIDAGKYRRAL